MAEVTHEQVPTNGIELHVAMAGPADGPPVVLCHGFPELWYSWRHQLGALADAGYRAYAPDLRGYGSSSRPSEVADYGSDNLTADLGRPARPLRLRPGCLRGPRLGGDGGVGDGTPPPRSRLVALQHERAVVERAGTADADLRGDLRGQVLLHALLPRGRAGRSGVRGGPAPVPAHHALLGRRRGDGDREPARRPPTRGHPLHGHPVPRTRHAPELDHRGGRRRLRGGVQGERLLRARQLLPQHGRQLGAFQGHPAPPCTPCPPASSRGRSTP